VCACVWVGVCPGGLYRGTPDVCVCAGVKDARVTPYPISRSHSLVTPYPPPVCVCVTTTHFIATQ